MSEQEEKPVETPVESEVAGTDQPEETIEADIIESSFVQSITANQDASVSDSFVGALNVAQNTSINDSLCAVVTSGQNSDVQNSFSSVVVAVGNVDYSSGGILLSNAGGNTNITDSKTGILLCQQANVEQSTVGILFASKATFGENVKVVMTTRQVIALGAAFGVAAALLGKLLFRKH